MQIPVTIPDELAARVLACGPTPEGYVEGLLAGQLEAASPVTEADTEADTAARSMNGSALVCRG